MIATPTFPDAEGQSQVVNENQHLLVSKLSCPTESSSKQRQHPTLFQSDVLMSMLPLSSFCNPPVLWPKDLTVDLLEALISDEEVSLFHGSWKSSGSVNIS